MDVAFSAGLANGVAAPPGRYLFEVRWNSRVAAGDDGAQAELVQRSIQLPADANFHAEGILDGTADNTVTVTASVLSADGMTLLTRAVPVADRRVAWQVSADDVAAVVVRRQAIPAAADAIPVWRGGRFVDTGGVRIDLGRARLVIAPVPVDANRATWPPPLQINPAQSTSIELTGQNLGNLSLLPWFGTPVAVDGKFQFAITPQETSGWLWWLTGSPSRRTGERENDVRWVIGFVPDNLANQRKGAIAIALPALAELSSSPEEADTGADDCDCDQRKLVPADVTETELVDNPSVFSEDPGAFCRPFSNPERILSERAFKVIARISQPDVGAKPSGKTRTQHLLVAPGDEPEPPRSTVGGFFARMLGGTAAVANIAAVRASPIRAMAPADYIRSVLAMPSGRTTLNADHPLQWEDDIAQYQSTSVAYGHLLEFRVRWRSNGYSLGTVAKTLTLAPRQTKRVQKIEWERVERARRSERTQQRDEENDSVVRERDYQDSVSAHLSEWSTGGSSSSMAGVAGGLGFFAGGGLGGIGGGASTASSSSHQEGGRDTTASEQQRLHDAIRRHGDSLRRFESTVVNEVTQEETVTGTTEVIRNPNYAHSLTVIYYQILRHLKVATEFGGVRECLFVPFAVKPFSIQRAYRWRESITAYIRERRFGRALRYLRDVATNFATSDIPVGRRARQRMTFVRGSVYVALGIERPRDAVDGGFVADTWARLQPYLGLPAFGIHASLFGVATAVRDRQFQAEFAPRIAAEWTNGLTLKLGSRTMVADFTLATRYQFNRVVRVDFVIPSSELAGLTREQMQEITFGHDTGLPPGSIANFRRATITYTTNRFERTIEGRSGVNDLVNPSSGDPGAAVVGLPLDEWERVDERREMREAVQELIEHLNEHVEYYHKAIWWRMDRDRLMMLLDGFYVPGTNGVSIASVVDREPLGIIGNALVYGVGAATFLGYGEVNTPQRLFDVYSDRRSTTSPLYVSLPTDGLYAQTIMDECEALEEHYGNKDWVLSDKDPDLGSIDPSLMLTRRADTSAVALPTTMPGTIINLQNAPEAPAPSGLQGVLNAVTTANAFRDMAGLAGTQANAQAALTTAANLATNFGNQAAALEMAKMAKASEATRTADQKLASIKNALDKDLTTPDAAKSSAAEVLKAMNPDSPKGQAPHENPVINRAIDRLPNVPGSTLTATTGEGSVSLAVGGPPRVINAGTTVPLPPNGGGGGGGGGGAAALPAVELLVNNSLAADAAYVAWAPRLCVLRNTNATAGRVLVRNVPQPNGGQLVFLTQPDSQPNDELLLDVPANGEVTFFTCGRYDRTAGVGFASSNDRDTAIVVSSLDGATEITRRDVMVRIRKNANTLTAAERDRFLAALMSLNQPGGVYPDFQNRHVDASSREIHRRSCFLPWHRAFLTDLERRLQEVDPSVALPYWRFDQPAPNVFTQDFLGIPTPGDPSFIVEFSPSNPLVNWRMRVLGSGSGRIDRAMDFDPATSGANITNDEVATLALDTNFADAIDPRLGFTSMEGDPHGAAHSSFGGPISDIGKAPGDPLFFLLHANVDRLWAKWQWTMIGQRFDGTQVPAYPNQGNGDPAQGDEPGIGNFTNDTMWPWNGVTGAPRPADAPGGPFPLSPSVGVPSQTPTVLEMIDYQGQHALDADVGFAYDDVPYDLIGEVFI